MMLSIITVHLDAPECLTRTKDSLAVAAQDEYTEWLVIDGGSGVFKEGAGGHGELIRSLATKFITEPDNGIYDAMNKGTRLARGDYVLYLNAGDELHPDFSRQQIEMELAEQNPGMIWGTCHERFPNGRIVRVKNRSPRLAWYGIPVNHQNVLFRRDLLGKRPYDVDLQYCADYDLIGRLMNQGCTVHRTATPISIFHRGGTSAQNFRQTIREEETLRSRHFGVSPFLSRLVTHLKIVNSKLGQVSFLRRLMRKWV